MNDLVDMITDPSMSRLKERNLQEIVDAVTEWRRLYGGVWEKDKKGRPVLKHYNLYEAAEKVGLSKKSLDDYLLQLRYGRKFGFDFEAHKHCKVGILRTFVRNERNKYLKTTGQTKMTSEEFDFD